MVSGNVRGESLGASPEGGKHSAFDSSSDRTRSHTPSESDRSSVPLVKVLENPPWGAPDHDCASDAPQGLWDKLCFVRQARYLPQAVDCKADLEPRWISLSRIEAPPPPPPPPPPAPYGLEDVGRRARRKQAPVAEPRPQVKDTAPPSWRMHTGKAFAGTTVSIGSVGHPFTCAAACKYARRKTGCKDGAKCPNCHECFWRRTVVANKAVVMEKAAEADQEKHPMRVDTAASAMKTLELMSASNAMQQAAGGAGSVVADYPADNDSLSVGSIGHPHSCAQACKYNCKTKGCKDGRFCVRCHICQWRRCLQ